MFCIAKLIEMLTIQERSLDFIRTELPRVYHKTHTVRCPWSEGGADAALVNLTQPKIGISGRRQDSQSSR